MKPHVKFAESAWTYGASAISPHAKTPPASISAIGV